MLFRSGWDGIVVFGASDTGQADQRVGIARLGLVEGQQKAAVILPGLGKTAVLHVVRYKRKDIDQLIAQINACWPTVPASSLPPRLQPGIAPWSLPLCSAWSVLPC